MHTHVPFDIHQPEPALHETRTLSFSRKPIRLIIDDDGIWFAARDLFSACRRETDRTILARFRPEHLKLFAFPNEGGPLRLIAVSALGAATVAKYAGAPFDRMLDGWVRNRTKEIGAEVGRPPLSMTLLADDTLPVRPRVVSDLYLPFVELRHRYGGSPRPLPTNMQALALLNEDLVLFPADPEAKARGGAFIAALIEAGSDQAVRVPVSSAGTQAGH